MVFAGQIVEMGDVAMHEDEQEHVAIILTINGDDCEALFFTSNPHWSVKSRKAKREELAMAGYVHSKITYLAYAQRPSWGFRPLGRSFPDHWIQSLKSEFGAIQLVTQVEKE